MITKSFVFDFASQICNFYYNIKDNLKISLSWSQDLYKQEQKKMDKDFSVNSDYRLEVDEQSAENLSPEPLSLEVIFHRYGIERSHAGNVARNALELFDILDSIHGLDPEMRTFVEIAALVHDTGVAKDLENHHKAGRNILRLHPPAELPEKL